jgi:uncharacterized RDD family membrane protein YckC
MQDATDDEIQLDAVHRVRTPEYVELTFVVAGLMSRFLALAIDTVLSVVLTMVLLLGVVAASTAFSSMSGPAAQEAWSGLGLAAAFIIWFVVDWGYMVVLETAWNGQTVGKRLFGLRVMMERGVRVSPLASVLRNVVRPVDKLPLFYLVGGVATLLTTSHQRLGDLLAGTVVIRERKRLIPTVLPSRENDPALAANPELRAHVAKLTVEEGQVLFSAAQRRDELGIEARLTFFQTLSAHFQTELGFVKPAHLSDEKLVLLMASWVAARNSEATGSTSKVRRGVDAST